MDVTLYPTQKFALITSNCAGIESNNYSVERSDTDFLKSATKFG
jgi:hypothetical protein